MSSRNDRERSAQKRPPKTRRKRDSVTGFLGLLRCELYLLGHTVHWIQANKSAGEPHRTGGLVHVEGNTLTVDFGDELKTYRNHDVERMVEIIGVGGTIQACERFCLLKNVAGYCFSIVDADRPWTPCDFEPITSFSPEALAERLQTRGGFSVPSHLLFEDGAGDDNEK